MNVCYVRRASIFVSKFYFSFYPRRKIIFANLSKQRFPVMEIRWKNFLRFQLKRYIPTSILLLTQNIWHSEIYTMLFPRPCLHQGFSQDNRNCFYFEIKPPSVHNLKQIKVLGLQRDLGRKAFYKFVYFYHAESLSTQSEGSRGAVYPRQDCCDFARWSRLYILNICLHCGGGGGGFVYS